MRTKTPKAVSLPFFSPNPEESVSYEELKVELQLQKSYKLEKLRQKITTLMEFSQIIQAFPVCDLALLLDSDFFKKQPITILDYIIVCLLYKPRTENLNELCGIQQLQNSVLLMNLKCVDIMAKVDYVAFVSIGRNTAETINQIFWNKSRDQIAQFIIDGITPLALAVIQGNFRVVDQLLKQGCDINQFGPGGFTALMVAAIIGNEIGLKNLLERGASMNLLSSGNQPRTALHWAAYYGHASVCQQLIESGAQVQALGWACNDSTNWGNVLHILMLNEDLSPVTKLSCAKILLSSGKLNVNAVTTLENYTALCIAAKQAEHDEIVRYLLEAGADINIETTGAIKYDAYGIAMVHNRDSIARLIVDHNTIYVEVELDLDINGSDKAFETSNTSEIKP